MNKKYIGIGGLYFHDAGLCRIDQEGNIEFASLAERYTGIKHDYKIPDVLWETVCGTNSLSSWDKNHTLVVNDCKVQRSKFRPKLHDLKVGDKLFTMDKASGFFVMDEVPDGKNLWMLATGTGLGVFISLFKTSAPWARFDNIILVHGVRNHNELAYQEQISEFKKNNPSKFNYIQTVTRETKDGCLNLRIPAAIESKKLEELAGINITNDSQFMICGNPDMINDTVELLGKKGLERNRRSKPGNITLEKYW